MINLINGEVKDLAELMEVIKKPFQDIKTYVIGLVVMVLSILVLPMFVLQGYLLEVARRSMKGNHSMPEWGNWGKLFMDGLMAYIISGVYIVVAFVLFLVLTLVLGIINPLLGLVGLLIGILLYLVFALAAIAAVLRFAKTGEFVGSLLAFGENFRKGVSVSMIVALIIGLILQILNIIPLILMFGTGVMMITVISEAYGKLK